MNKLCLALFFLLSQNLLFSQEPATPSIHELEWLRSKVHPLNSLDPSETNTEDLRILHKVAGDAKLIALGENSHGSKEIFQLKHRIIKYLAENHSFTTFSIEANMPESYKINSYISDNKGNPEDYLKGMYFWTWQTKEVLEMVKWMKEFNGMNKSRPIHFTGFDMQAYIGPIDVLKEVFKDNPKIDTLLMTLNSIRNSSRKEARTIATEAEKIMIRTIFDSLKAQSADFTDKDWILKNINLIEQYIQRNPKTRDSFMAENLLWIKKQNPESKIVVWAHNEHIKKAGQAMGKFVSDKLGTDYFSIGFTFYEGSFTALNMADKALSECNAEIPLPGTYEYLFNLLDQPVFLLDLKKIRNDKSEFAKKMTNNLKMRKIGALCRSNQFIKTDLADDFDALIFIKKSSPAESLVKNKTRQN